MDVLLPQLVTRQAETSPDSHAIDCCGEILSYADLDRLSASLATVLVDSGARRGDRIGIFMDKCAYSAVAMYGIMRSGAAYVPLDPAAPVDRLATIIRDCGIRQLVSQANKRRALTALAAQDTAQLHLVGPDAGSIAGLQCTPWETVASTSPDRLPRVKILESDLAYIIYTSGSTGPPKGIMHTHHSGLSFARWAAGEYGLTRADRISNHAPLHFDLSILDYFAAAVVGATTCVIPEEFTRLPASYSQLVADQRMTVLYTVPYSLIQLLTRGVVEQRDLSALRWIIFGGEPYPSKHLRALMDLLPHVRFDNMYGPAEINGCSHYTIPEDFDPEDEVSIGTIASIAESRIHDENDEIVAIGEIGELLVRTPTMMQGYWSRPDLNEQAFFRRRVAVGIEHVYYRTGDLVREDERGLMFFAGRKDRQVKIRGYRIELDEIESALTAIDGVEESAVFAVPDGEGSKTLLAAVILETGAALGAPELAVALRKRVPPYAIPAAINCTDDFPRTSTGKIDRTRLSQDAILAGIS